MIGLRQACGKKNGDAGWLAPDGKFYACDSRMHDRYALLVLHSTPDALDKLGYVHVYGAPGKSSSFTAGKDWIIISRHPTEAQIKWLEKCGHTIDAYDREERF